jgi:hypothetical protein
MGAMERQVCKMMGRECCGAGAGQLSHAPVTPLPSVVATTLAALSLPEPVASPLSRQRPVAPAAIVQGVGLFTLFTAFLI